MLTSATFNADIRPLVDPRVAGVLGKAPSMASVIGGSNIQDQHGLLPETAAARVNNYSSASTEQRENASRPTWKTSGADILSNDSISPTLIPTPISLLALSDGRAPQIYSPTDIPGEAIPSTGSTSTHEREVIGGDPQPIVQLRGLPAEEFEDDVSKLEERLLQKGAEPSAVGVCAKIFSKGISIAALEVPMTRKESIEHGVVGKRYRMLLEKRTESGGTKNRCRLCSQQGLVEYKNHRDALRHLLKDHFGMGYECEYNWYVWCWCLPGASTIDLGSPARKFAIHQQSW